MDNKRVYENEEMNRAHMKSHKPKMAEDKPMPNEEADGESPEGIIEAHGPAHTTRIEKKDENSYSVHSHHDDGHKHVSHGHDVHAAHSHSMHMHTGQAPMEEHAEPIADEHEHEMAPASIPGM